MQKSSNKQKNPNDDDNMNNVDQDDSFLTTMQVQQQEIAMPGNYYSQQHDKMDDGHPRRLLSHPHFIQKISRYIRIPPGDYVRPIELSHINQGWDETFWHYQTLHTTFWNKTFRWYPPSVVIKNIAARMEVFKESVANGNGKIYTDTTTVSCVKRKSNNNDNNNNVSTAVDATGIAAPAMIVDCHYCDGCLYRRVVEDVAGLAVNSFNVKIRLAALVAQCDPSINGMIWTGSGCAKTEHSQNLKFYNRGPAASENNNYNVKQNDDTPKKFALDHDIYDSLWMKSKIWNAFRFCFDDSFYKWIQQDITDVKDTTFISERQPSPLSGLSFKSHVLPFLVTTDRAVAEEKIALTAPNNDYYSYYNNKNAVPRLKNILLVGRLLFDGFMQQPALMQRLFSRGASIASLHNRPSITGYLQRKKASGNVAAGANNDILIHALLIDCIQYACDSNFLENNNESDNNNTTNNNGNNDDDKNSGESPSSPSPSIADIRTLTSKPPVEIFTTLFDSFFKASVLMRSSLRIANATDIGRLSMLSPIFACSASISPVLEAILGGNIWCLEIMLDRIVFWTKTRQSLQETGVPGLDDDEIRKAKSKILRKNVMIKNQADSFKYSVIFAADGSESSDASAYGSYGSPSYVAADGVPRQYSPGVEAGTSAANTTTTTTTTAPSTISAEKDMGTFILRSAAPATALDLAGHCGNAEMYSHLWNEYYKEYYLAGADDGVLSRFVAANGFIQYDLFDISLVQLPVLAAFPIAMDHLKLPAKMMMMKTKNDNNNNNSNSEQLAINRLKIFGMKLKHLVEKWNQETFLKQEQQRKEYLEQQEDKRNLHKLAHVILESEKNFTSVACVNDQNRNWNLPPETSEAAPAAASSTISNNNNNNSNPGNPDQQQGLFGAVAPTVKFADHDESFRTYSLKQHISWTLRLCLAAITTFYTSNDIMTAPLHNTEHLLQTAFEYLQVFFENVPVEIIQEALATAFVAAATRASSSLPPVTNALLNQFFIEYSSSTYFLLRLLMKPTTTSAQHHHSSESSCCSSSSIDYSEKIHSLVHSHLFSSPSSKNWLRDLVEILDGFSSHAPIWVLVDLFDRVNKTSTADSMMDTFNLLLESGSNVFRKKMASAAFFDPTPLLISDPRCRKYAKLKVKGAVNESASLLAAHFHPDGWKWRMSENFKRRDLECEIRDLSGITLLHRLCIRLPRRMYIEAENKEMHEGFRGDEKVEEEASKFQTRMNLSENAVRSLLRRIELHEKGGIDTVRQFVGTRTENLLLTASDFAETFMLSKMKNIFEEEFGVVTK